MALVTATAHAPWPAPGPKTSATGRRLLEWEDGFGALPASLAERVAHHSRNGAIAYVEAGFFGGAGSQDVRVWQGGAAVLELHEEDWYGPPEG